MMLASNPKKTTMIFSVAFLWLSAMLFPVPSDGFPTSAPVLQIARQTSGRWGSQLTAVRARKKKTSVLSFREPDDFDDRFWKNVALLEQYKERYGTANMPTTGCRRAPCSHITRWIVYIRGVNNRLRRKQKAALESLGFDFDGNDAIEERKKRKWEELFNRLKRFKSVYNHCRVPTRFEDGELAYFVLAHRMLYKDGKLEESRVARLNRIGFEWPLQAPQCRQPKPSSRFEKLWNLQYQKLEDFSKKYNHTRVSVEYPANHNLTIWTRTQRWSFATKRLRPDRKDLLDKLNFIWDYREEVSVPTWEKMYNQLKHIYEEEEKCSTGKKTTRHGTIYRKGALPSLSSWASEQRKLQKKGVLDPEKKAKLDQIGFRWDICEYKSSVARWNTMFNRLKLYYKENPGEVFVRKDMPLRRWVAKQRREKRRGLLKPERKAMLDGIGFDWEPTKKVSLR